MEHICWRSIFYQTTTPNVLSPRFRTDKQAFCRGHARISQGEYEAPSMVLGAMQSRDICQFPSLQSPAPSPSSGWPCQWACLEILREGDRKVTRDGEKTIPFRKMPTDVKYILWVTRLLKKLKFFFTFGVNKTNLHHFSENKKFQKGLIWYTRLLYTFLGQYKPHMEQRRDILWKPGYPHFRSPKLE